VFDITIQLHIGIVYSFVYNSYCNLPFDIFIGLDVIVIVF